MNQELLKRHIRRILSTLIKEQLEEKYLLQFSQQRKQFVLFKVVHAADKKHVIVVKELGTDIGKAEKMAKEITGQDLKAKDPNEVNQPKGFERENVILPFDYVKGKRIGELPFNTLVNYAIKPKWMKWIRQDKYLQAIYDYLTIDRLDDTILYFKRLFRDMNLSRLILWYNDRVRSGDNLVFSDITLPLLQREIEKRNIQLDADGQAIPPENLEQEK